MKPTETKSKSSGLYEEARKYLPGGISRNTIYRKPHPDYAVRGSGSRVTDVEGVTRTDFVNNMASLIHGHSHPKIVEAVTEQLALGTAFTMATEAELRMARTICSRNPCFEKIRFMNSGTEAVMAAIKAARAVTGRPKIAKVEGSYHGTYDYAEVSQKSKPENWGAAERPASVPVAQGTPQTALDDVIVVPFNHVEQTIELLNQNVGELACVLIDPLAHRVGLVQATDEYVNALREWTRENDVLFVFDEVITFRMKFGGAQQWYDVEPDLTSLGKIIGGGFPVGALAGKNEFMEVLDPTRDNLPFPHSGTFSANPVTMTAGRVAMELFDEVAVAQLNGLGAYARKKIEAAIESAGIDASITGGGSMLRLHLSATPPLDYRSAYHNPEIAQQIAFIVNHAYDRGFMLMNTCSIVLSTAHNKTDVDQLASVLEEALATLP